MDPNSIPIEQWMLDELRLRGARLIVFALVYSAHGPIRLSRGEMAHQCGLHESTVRRACAALERDGLIRLASPEDARRGMAKTWIATASPSRASNPNY